MLTDQDNRILRDKFKPEAITVNHKQRKHHCVRCGELMVNEKGNPTPIVRMPCKGLDPYPGSEADIAEKIRQWLEKQDEPLKREYFTMLMATWSTTSKEFAFTAWLIYCTPSDKIHAFIAMFKGEQK